MNVKYHPLYSVWTNMKYRCIKPNHKRYHDYGGRGIEICDEWLNSFHQFVSDMGERPDGFELDRIDNDKGYCKENCRWIDSKTNKRSRRNTRWVSINDKEYTLRDLSEEYNISYDTLIWRWRTGIRGKDIIKPSRYSS